MAELQRPFPSWGNNDYTCGLMHRRFTSLELCAGAGGQALGLEMAGFHHKGLVEIEPVACETLLRNRPHWNVIQADLNSFDASAFDGVDVLAAGLPCPPFSVAGKQLGESDERNLFPAALRIIGQVRPKAIMIENVRGFLDPSFAEYRASLKQQLKELGYQTDFKLLHAADYGVSQLRPRVVIVAMLDKYFPHFEWPVPKRSKPKTVGETLYELMASGGWSGAKGWREKANSIAPTIVGGSKKHGGPDLGPTRARLAWAALGVDGIGIANDPPTRDFDGIAPKLTVPMVALIQGFPESWHFAGKKTSAYRQVGNAFPPPVAYAVASQIHKALSFELALQATG